MGKIIRLESQGNISENYLLWKLQWHLHKIAGISTGLNKRLLIKM